MKVEPSSLIQNDPGMKTFLSRMPQEVAESFSQDQLFHIRNAIGARRWGKHKVDIRTTFGLFAKRYYLVLLMGANQRQLTTTQMRRQRILNAFMLTFFITSSLFFGLSALYLLKSALGIDIFENFSLGLWR